MTKLREWRSFQTFAYRNKPLTWHWNFLEADSVNSEIIQAYPLLFLSLLKDRVLILCSGDTVVDNHFQVVFSYSIRLM